MLQPVSRQQLPMWLSSSHTPLLVMAVMIMPPTQSLFEQHRHESMQTSADGAMGGEGVDTTSRQMPGSSIAVRPVSPKIGITGGGAQHGAVPRPALYPGPVLLLPPAYFFAKNVQ